MSSSEQRGSFGISESDSFVPHQSRIPDRDDWPPDDPRDTSYNFYTHPSRTSILGSVGDLLLEPSPSNILATTRTISTDMEETGHDETASAWRSSTGTLPSFSRAFDIFMNAEDGGGSEGEADDKFFVPSYLESSTYMQKLQEAYRLDVQAKREARRSASSNITNNGTNFQQTSLPAGSHRGMTHNVIERPSSSENEVEEASLFPLPSQWNKLDAAGGLDIQADGVGVKFPESRAHFDREHEACSVRTNNHIPLQCGIYYYEVQVLAGKREDTIIGIGFATKSAAMTRAVGWEPESWGYHGDDGRCYAGQKIGRPYGFKFATGDVIGCGINFHDRTAFYTRNGVKIGIAFTDVLRGKLYPTVSLKRPGEFIVANFGETPFVFNIDDVVKEQRLKIQKQIMETDTSGLEPGLNETDLIHTLVMQFLQHDGYVETARAFAEDLNIQNTALRSKPSSKAAGINIRDDEDANNRQKIRRSILEGDIDRALKYTNAYYPQVLKDNEQVYFKLRCRKFIEMVRKAAQLNAAAEDSRNGNAPSQEMDVDENSSEPDEAVDPAKLQELELNMLQYGQSLQADFASDSRKDIANTLNEIWALVAYPNPLKEPSVSHLLDRKGRGTVAEELNSAILTSLGKSSRASLEKLYAQTSVLLEELREEGGDGAFVSVQDVLEDLSAITEPK